MGERAFQYKIGRFMLLSNALIFVLLCIFYFLPGFTDDELASTLKLVVPVESVYMAAIIKFLIGNKKASAANEPDEQLSGMYMSISKTIIYSHAGLIVLAITAKALGAISFPAFTNFLVIIETCFGAYVGSILTDLFGIAKKEEKESEA